MKIEPSSPGISSQTVHSDHTTHAEHAHLVPIYATSTFTFDSAEQGMNRFGGKEKGFIYSRFGNPTTASVAAMVASLEAIGLKDENGEDLKLKALLHASGQAAMVTMFLSNLSSGDAVLSHFSLYGGTHEFLYDVLPRFGIKSLIGDLANYDELEAIIKKNPSIKIIHIETPANPTMRCIDLEKVTALAKKNKILVTVDNTFATPYLQQPFRYGVDFVFHSTTKFLNGHGSAIGGVLVGRDINFMSTTANKFHMLLGSNASPFDAFLLSTGIKTLSLRMEKHCSNANVVAEFLSQHPAVSKVNFNGLSSHVDYHITKKQMRHAGAVLSFELAGGIEAGKKFINNLAMCTKAVSLGTVDSLLSHPASMSHSGMSREDRLKSGVTDGLIRMSVGLEAAEDIVADLLQALENL
ncbi:MAG: aminotransferase class I/II-fold pyridoxal phosphate-dependent enzyme [Chitinophagaceae bacterium]|nr:aminotransferase class I/II-fold pyridoxal phosphate-dependent enzyme [Chitinophagaceae bacterium]